MAVGLRELLSRGLYYSGVSRLLAGFPQQDLLVVLNYHRIGDPSSDLFDPGVFSATAGEFEDQVRFLKRSFPPVTLEEALAYLDGKAPDRRPRCRTLITFDDGYLDNYEAAYPILRAHGVQGVFFLATGIAGSSHVPWWDEVAYIMKTARRRKFDLRYPAPLAVDLDTQLFAAALRNVLQLYKRPENTDGQLFLAELRESAQGDEPPKSVRRFLNWDEAREMIQGGMAIGSHTHSHHVLSQLEPDRQREELALSYAILAAQLGKPPTALAYPVGNRNSYSPQTQRLAGETGYRAAFSFHGGTNRAGTTNRFDIKRVGVDGQSRARFRVQAAVCGCTGRHWP
jgi:peptidoglycan/xylan/chitin deacetylase (PgdA/CDA1 family)